MVETILQALVAGILVGCLYGVMSAGLGVIFGVMRVINFAQGDLMMLGMYLAWYIFTVAGIGALVGPYAGPFVAVLIGAPIMYGAGYLLHRTLVVRVSGERTSGQDGDGHYSQLILTLGVSLVLQSAALIFFSSDPRSIRTPLSYSAWEIPLPFLPDMSLFLNQGRTAVAVVAVLIAVGLYLLITRTSLGKSLRAAADNAEAAVYLGIDVDRSHTIAFAIGTLVTAIAGGMMASFYPFHPYIGLDFVIVMYAGVVLGGLGSILGAFWGGLTIGLVQQLSTLVLPIQLQNTAVFIVFLAVVFLRPQGFFGRNVERV